MGSFLVIGMGRFGSAVATELYRMRHEVLAVDAHEDNVTGILDQVTNVIIGDAKDDAVLASLGVQNFDCVVVSMASAIEDSVLTTIKLKEMSAKMIVCKAQNEWHAKVLSLIGATKVIHPESDMGKRIAHSLAQRNIIDYLEISPDYGVLEIKTPKRWVDKSIIANNIRRKYGINVIAIRSAETDRIQTSPHPDTVLREGDILTVIGSKQELDEIGALT
ncbi:MAG: TrkA family potassium uptake protein [Peptococcaceae bacterium]|jgi:trk system potassium uptake protein TrkA|nr:TrkA family potassium uptake protein [Peptococcaceae bacterium]MDR2736674.1 TrkA family potassium uptake protein [Gracilibacteraceae bacterium]